MDLDSINHKVISEDQLEIIISEDQLEITMAVFLGVHEDCPHELVEFHRGKWSLVCWCRWCSDLKTYEF